MDRGLLERKLFSEIRNDLVGDGPGVPADHLRRIIEGKYGYQIVRKPLPHPMDLGCLDVHNGAVFVCTRSRQP